MASLSETRWESGYPEGYPSYDCSYYSATSSYWQLRGAITEERILN